MTIDLNLSPEQGKRVSACCDREIRDAVLTHRKGNGVKELSFFRLQVDDACLVHLAELTTLEWLELYGTQVTRSPTPVWYT